MAVIIARIQWPTPGYMDALMAWRSHLSNERNREQLQDLKLVVLGCLFGQILWDKYDVLGGSSQLVSG